MKRALWALVIAVPSVALLAFGFSRDPNAVRSPLINKPATPFALRSLDGGQIALRALRGRPVLVNFWASWCTGCVDEHPVLAAAWQRYRGRMAFVGISYQDSASAARTFMRQHGVGWQDASDPAGQTALNFGVYGVPETFLLDRSGVIRYKSTGPVSWDILSAQIDHLLRSSA